MEASVQRILRVMNSIVNLTSTSCRMGKILESHATALMLSETLDGQTGAISDKLAEAGDDNKERNGTDTTGGTGVLLMLGGVPLVSPVLAKQRDVAVCIARAEMNALASVSTVLDRHRPPRLQDGTGSRSPDARRS